LVDDQGTRLKNTVAAMAMAELALRASPGATIAVPVTMPNVFEQIAAQHGGRVIRTKADAYALATASEANGVQMAADGAGSFFFPQFQCASDGLMATAKLLEFLATQHTTLSEVVASLPPFYMAHERVPCPWEVKGAVMRQLHERCRGDLSVETTDGIKIKLNSTEWVLLLPDPDRPLLQIYAEAASLVQATELIRKYADLVEELQP
jgi:mannose-1-phosphate guanylyltransferase/phosphomannomutase